MRKEHGITMITLVVTIIVLIILAGVSITTLIGNNGIITKAKQARENITYAGIEERVQLNQLFWEIEQNGEYSEEGNEEQKDQMIELLQKQVEELKQQVADLQEKNDSLEQEQIEAEEEIKKLNEQINDLNNQITDLEIEVSEKEVEMADLQKEVALKQETINNLQNQLDTLNSLLSQTNATEAHILKDYKAYSGGKLIVGTMANNGAVSANLNAGQSYTIPAGYHNGSGKITANSLASQTQATATAQDIAEGKTAYVNGEKITGTASSTNGPVITKITTSAYTGRTWNYCIYNCTIVVKANNAKSFTLNEVNPATIASVSGAAYEGLTFFPVQDEVTIVFEQGKGDSTYFGGDYYIVSYE